MIFINLPPIPEHLAQEVSRLIKIPKLRLDGIKDAASFRAEFYRNGKQIADYYLCSPKYVDKSIPPELFTVLNEIQKFYSNYLPIDHVSAIRFMNVQRKGLSTRPPHVDVMRKLGINYYIELGGSNVVTNFYQDKRPYDSDLSLAKGKDLSDDRIELSTVIPKDQWIAFNAQTYHSIENVENTRIIVAIILPGNPTLEEFIETYPHLILNDIQL